MAATLYPNRLAERRVAIGLRDAEVAAASGVAPHLYERMEAGTLLPTLDEFDRIREVLGGVAPEDLYSFGLVNTIGGTQPEQDHVDYARFFQDPLDAAHLLVSRDETTWIETATKPDRTVDVFVNMSCATQKVPHLILDTVSVLQALGVDFAAGAGRLFCCGSYYRGNRETDAAARMNAASLGRSVAWGATTTVHWCTQCQNTFTDFALRQEVTGQQGAPMQHIQVLAFVKRLLEERGAAIPWRREVRAKVLVHGLDISPVHLAARQDVADILALVPGIEVVGIADGTFPAQSRLESKDPSQVREVREEIAEYLRARGADTLSSQHQGGHIRLARLASPTVSVRHCISIVADALGVAHPDRYQAAALLGDPAAIVEQTRPIWSSWGMDTATALAHASELFHPAYAAGSAHCTCGGNGDCREVLITVDVLAGGRPVSSATRHP